MTARKSLECFLASYGHGSKGSGGARWPTARRRLLLQIRRSVLRYIRVASKQGLKQLTIAGIKDVNRHPVIHPGPYHLAEAA
jgi:hypothetical protein